MVELNLSDHGFPCTYISEMIKMVLYKLEVCEPEVCYVLEVS